MTDEIKFFSVEEANRTLPLVKRVVSDIIEAYSEWRERVRRFDLEVGLGCSPIESTEHAAAREAIEIVAQRINGYIEELQQIGCVLKGFDDGLVDFHSNLDGKHVFLCWRYGEDGVSHWHALDGGFAGRMPLTSELVQRNAD